ncbi:MAG TPA: protein kinase, partial [Myxococcales bacterium]|nr:protein kinase [Myxococcales bacterium]
MTETQDNRPVPHVPGYRVERFLGAGGFGVVLEAVSDSGERVALKISTADAVAAAQLAREEKALRAVGPAIGPEVRASGTLADGSAWMALELLPPPTLAQRIEQIGGPMHRSELSDLAPALLDAVAGVHAHGFVHLDLKPANIFISQGVRLIDFGLAWPLGQRQPRGQAFAGTAEYASPEQCEEKVDLDARADVYSLGVIFFELLTGRPPFVGEAQAVREAHVGLRPPRPSQLTPMGMALEQVVLRCLTKDRGRRYQGAADLKAALRAGLIRESTPHPTPPAVTPVPARALERRQVGLLFFTSGADVGSVQSAVRSLGGELGHAARGRYAAIFAGEAGQDPVRRAYRAAQGLAERGLAPRALVDLGAVNAQRRPDGTIRYISPELGREDRYAAESDPLGPLATAAAAEVLAEIGWDLIAGRSGVFASRQDGADRLQSATVIQLGAGPLVGREDVVRSLVAAARDAAEGNVPSVTTVTADPGYGKTHLAAALLERLRAQLPVLELMDLRARDPVAGAAGETLRALLVRALELPPDAGEESARARFTAAVGRAAAAELWPAAALTLRLVPPDATLVRSLAAAPGVLRSMAMRAVGEALRARARRRPLCLLLDDAQFADDTALDALEYAALAEAQTPIFVCALARPSFTATRASFGERAARRELHQLGPLAPERAAELCRRLLAPAENVPAAAIDRLVQRTQGVPLLLVELVRGLKRDGVVRKRMRGDTWFLAADELDKLPDSPLVEWLAERELAALPQELAAHARLAALLGPEVSAEEIEGVVNRLDEERMAAEFPLDAQVATRRLAGLGLLVTTRTGSFRFRHALVRDAVERSLPAAQRTRIHSAAARFYRMTGALPEARRLPLLARHTAEAGLREEAAELHLRLAEDARSRHAYVDAERSYSQVLLLLGEEDRPGRLSALRGRGSMRYRISRYDDALADLEAAKSIAKAVGDSSAEAEILLDAATALDWMGDFPRSRALVEEAQALPQASTSQLLRARLLMGHARALHRVDRNAEAAAGFKEAVRIAESVGDAGYETLIISLV